MITIEDFSKVELRVAQIKEAKEHPDADRLLVLQIDLGDEQRQLVAGIKRGYSPEELIGKKVVIVANLQPATIRGVESNGMLLAASDDNTIGVLTPERDIALGSRVK